MSRRFMKYPFVMLGVVHVILRRLERYLLRRLDWIDRIPFDEEERIESWMNTGSVMMIEYTYLDTHCKSWQSKCRKQTAPTDSLWLVLCSPIVRMRGTTAIFSNKCAQLQTANIEIPKIKNKNFRLHWQLIRMGSYILCKPYDTH